MKEKYSPTSVNPTQMVLVTNKALRIFSKIVCLATILLIFVGGMVTSTNSGLSVPDWPLSYGSLFPPMVGGVFYEHGHRMVAALVGLLTLILAVWIGIVEYRRWVQIVGFTALGLVIFQGILGGITVKLLLPTFVSVLHAVMAQTFFILTIVIAYSQSIERHDRSQFIRDTRTDFLKLSLGFVIVVYIQLILGAVMRHTGSGLAIPDFPQMGGEWLPRFDTGMLAWINDWRFERAFDNVSMLQVVTHFVHRCWACVVIVFMLVLNRKGLTYYQGRPKIFWNIIILNILLAVQVILGIYTVLTEKMPIITTAHVFVGAITLGTAVLLVLRVAPISLSLLRDEIRLKKSSDDS